MAGLRSIANTSRDSFLARDRKWSVLSNAMSMPSVSQLAFSGKDTLGPRSVGEHASSGGEAPFEHAGIGGIAEVGENMEECA